MKQFLTILLLLSTSYIFSQTTIPVNNKKDTVFHDPSTYIDFQFLKNDKPLITSQLWMYIKKMYIEARYNYEDRQTFSLYVGRSFKMGKDNVFEVIPMIGGSVGKFKGISPATTMILEAGWIRGFSQNQYSVNLAEKNQNFFFDWTALVVHTYKPIYLGVSLQNFALQNSKKQLYFGPMVSVKKLPVIIEVFAYNLYTNLPMWALGTQYIF